VLYNKTTNSLSFFYLFYDKGSVNFPTYSAEFSNQTLFSKQVRVASALFCFLIKQVSRSTADGTGYLQRTDTTHESNLNVRHAALIITSRLTSRALRIICMTHRNVPYKRYIPSFFSITTMTLGKCQHNGKSTKNLVQLNSQNG